MARTEGKSRTSLSSVSPPVYAVARSGHVLASVVMVGIGLLTLFAARPALAYTLFTYRVEMRDGIQLATDCYLPDENRSRRGTILARTPYNKADESFFPDELIGSLVDQAGYNLVIQDMRGRFASQGVDRVFADDGWGVRQDGADTVAWIIRQPWSDGKVGTYGGSALGIAQYMLAGAAPPGLTCQYVLMAASSLYHQAVRQGGGYRKALAEGWLKAQGSLHVIDTFERHPLYDDYWRGLDLATRWSVVNVPILHVGGWYDTFLDGAISSFRNIQAQGNEGARGKQVLLVGPWVHDGLWADQQGELTYPQTAQYDDDHVLDWFNYCLRGEQNQFATGSAVKYYVMGDVDDAEAPGNYWAEASEWPPKPAEAVGLYLHASGRMDRVSPSPDEPSITYVNDPEDPVPTLGGANLIPPKGPVDQRPNEQRSDVVVYSTDPLPGPVEVIGRVEANLWVAVDQPDTDFAVRLTDVYPDGRSMLVADGIIRAQHRNGYTAVDPVTPGEPLQVTVDLWDTAIVFNEGHRIRISVSGTNAERFGANPNTGAPWTHRPVVMRKASCTVYGDCARSSTLRLPVTAGIEHLGATDVTACMTTPLSGTDAGLDGGGVPQAPATSSGCRLVPGVGSGAAGHLLLLLLLSRGRRARRRWCRRPY